MKLSQKRIVAKSSPVRNMSIYLYLIKLLRNNFITFLHFYKPLNYESSLMRNNYYILKNDAYYRPRFVIIIIKKKKLNE